MQNNSNNNRHNGHNNNRNNGNNRCRTIGKRPINDNFVSVRDYVCLKKTFIKFVTTTDRIFKEKFGIQIADVAGQMHDDCKNGLVGAKIHETYNNFRDKISEAFEFRTDVEVQKLPLFQTEKCCIDNCQKYFISYRKCTRKQKYCNVCRSIVPLRRKCMRCDIKFKPVFLWSKHCRACCGIDNRLNKKCSKCRQLFKQKIQDQTDCKLCIIPKLGTKICLRCSKQFFPTFPTSYTCAICHFKMLSQQSPF